MSGKGRSRRGAWGIVRIVLIAGIVGFVLIQLVPYGRDHSNPPVVAEPAWDRARTRELAAGSCFDCHSNQTVWRWYSNVAPVSWLIQHDVEDGRASMNFSEWNRGQPDANEFYSVIAEGGMPPPQYWVLHPGAKLSDAEKQELISGLRATFASSPPPPGGGGG